MWSLLLSFASLRCIVVVVVAKLETSKSRAVFLDKNRMQAGWLGEAEIKAEARDCCIPDRPFLERCSPRSNPASPNQIGHYLNGFLKGQEEM